MGWFLDADGIDHTERGYFIAAERLDEMRDNDTLNWPMQLASKGWMDASEYRDFAAVFSEAIERFGIEIEPEVLSESIARGQARNAWGRAHDEIYRQIKPLPSQPQTQTQEISHAAPRGPSDRLIHPISRRHQVSQVGHHQKRD